MAKRHQTDEEIREVIRNLHSEAKAAYLDLSERVRVGEGFEAWFEEPENLKHLSLLIRLGLVSAMVRLEP